MLAPRRTSYLSNELDDEIGASAISLDNTGGAGITFNSQNAFKSVRESQRCQHENSQKMSPDNGGTPSIQSESKNIDKLANLPNQYVEETSLPDTDRVHMAPEMTPGRLI